LEIEINPQNRDPPQDEQMEDAFSGNSDSYSDPDDEIKQLAPTTIKNIIKTEEERLQELRSETRNKIYKETEYDNIHEDQKKKEID
jgi:hypothetical protein